MKIFDLKPGMSISNAASQTDGDAVLLRLAPGIYREKVYIRNSGVSIIGMGDDPSDVVIECDDYALFMMPDGVKRGTFRSYTFFIKGDDNRLENLSVKNTSGPGNKYGQCIALFAEGDRFKAVNCIFDSFQDTLFTGPLPLKEIEPGGFRGPTEYDERIIGKQYYKKCRISGDVDFIFGSSVCFFEECDIVSKGPGYCAAPSTYEGCEYGYVFSMCRFINEGCPGGSAFIARPWRDYGRAVLLSCYLGEHINEKGFHDWDKTSAHDKFYFAEYGSYGPGASENRADFVHFPDDSSLKFYSKDKVLS